MAATKGSYVLLIDLAESARLTVGRLGTFEFPPGLYFYCGSALNGLEARLRRHLRQDKKLHWHIDYLTAVAPVVRVLWTASEERWECRWAEVLMNRGCNAVARGFGSSDCRCSTHLLRKNDDTDADALVQMLFNLGRNSECGIWTAGEHQNSPSFLLGESS